MCLIRIISRQRLTGLLFLIVRLSLFCLLLTHIISVATSSFYFKGRCLLARFFAHMLSYPGSDEMSARLMQCGGAE